MKITEKILEELGFERKVEPVEPIDDGQTYFLEHYYSLSIAYKEKVLIYFTTSSNIEYENNGEYKVYLNDTDIEINDINLLKILIKTYQEIRDCHHESKFKIIPLNYGKGL